MHNVLVNIGIGLVGIFEAVIFFLPHFKTRELIVKFEDGVECSGKISGLYFIGFVVYGTLILDDNDEDS